MFKRSLDIYKHAPQFVTFKEGKLGVNFGGYHAAVGLGGLLGGDVGAGGGLFAEAGTPYGQAARAGLGGSVGGNGAGPSGGLYAGATAGGNVKAEAGLGGEVAGERTSGGTFASASSGGHYSSSGLVATSGVQEAEVNIPVKEVKATHNKVNTEVKLVAANEIIPTAKFDANANFEVKADAQPAVIVKEVYVEPPPPQVLEKTIIRVRKPHRHHFKKTAYIGGYIGAGADANVEQPNVVKVIQPIERRSDVGSEGEIHADASAGVNSHHGGSGEVTYTKKVTVQRNPTFFQDIFNIPISTLKAVNSFLTNAAGSTSVSVQKSASVSAESDLASSKHVPASKSVASSSEAHVSVQTPSATKFIDDIFSIPINTLSAVNTFLENNAARKQVQINGEVSDEPTKVRLGPHARRRANKQVIILQEQAKADTAEQKSE